MNKYFIIFLLAISVMTRVVNAEVSLNDSCQKKGKNHQESICVKTDGLLKHNIETEVMTVPDTVLIEYGDLKALGKNLYADGKKQYATMEGSPWVKAIHGEEISIEMGKLRFDAVAEMVIASGGARFIRTTDSNFMQVEMQSLLFHTSKRWLRSKNPATLYFKTLKKDAGEQDPEPVQEIEQDAVGKKKDLLNIEELSMTTGPLYYGYERQWVAASGPVTVEFNGGSFNAGSMEGSMAEKTVDFNDGVEGDAAGVFFSADRVRLYYATQTQEVEAFGNINIRDENGHTLNYAEYLKLCYKKGHRAYEIRGTEQQDIEVHWKVEKEDAATDSVDVPPKGDSE